MADFRWTKRKYRAATLIAKGELSYEAIGAEVGVSDVSIYKWRQYPEFAAKVQSHRDKIEQAVRDVGIAQKVNRVRVLNDLHEKMLTVLAERGADPEMQAVPGGKTGLVVHNVKGVGKGADFQLIDLYEVDTGTLKEIREHQKQVANELGQWVEKSESIGKEPKDMTDEELRAATEGTVRR